MKAFIEVHLKLVITIWIILVSVLGLLYLMNHMKFNSLMSDVVSSRLQVMSGSLERSIIKADQLGLQLRSMDNLPELLQRAQGRDNQVRAIHVIDHRGEVIFSTDNNQLGKKLSSELLRRALKGNEASWSLDREDTLYSGLQLFDGVHQLMGSIVIAYNKSSYGSLLAQVKLHLLEMTLMIFGGFALLIFIAVRLGFGDVNNVFKLITGQLAEDNRRNPEAIKPGTVAHQFAEQIERSNEMKTHVTDELEAISQDARHTKPTRTARKHTEKTGLIHD
ncbi:hypothetical protein [Marinobacterium jannaschii]|uniref:hypothetical protein n=1 Tax=Marinobacterium jannaschii TaxID=64970 RepID=UPI0004839237|nr:hypothetical protein [Marinobacterium jannaschii]